MRCSRAATRAGRSGSRRPRRVHTRGETGGIGPSSLLPKVPAIARLGRLRYSRTRSASPVAGSWLRCEDALRATRQEETDHATFHCCRSDGLGGERCLRPGQGNQDRRHLRLDRPVRGRRLGGRQPSAPRYAIDMINETRRRRGLQDQRRSTPTPSRKADVAINEAERLLNQEKVDLLMGVFSQRALRADGRRRSTRPRRFMWANVCISSAVFKDKNLKYVFRAAGPLRPVRRGLLHLHRTSNAKAKLGKEPKDLQGRDHLRGRPLRRRASPRATRRRARSSACRSCSRKATRPPRPTSRRWSPSCAARAPTSSCTPATTPTSRCSCARRASRA